MKSLKNIDDATHRKLKIMAAERGITMLELLRTLIAQSEQKKAKR